MPDDKPTATEATQDLITLLETATPPTRAESDAIKLTDCPDCGWPTFVVGSHCMNCGLRDEQAKPYRQLAAARRYIDALEQYAMKRAPSFDVCKAKSAWEAVK